MEKGKLRNIVFKCKKESVLSWSFLKVKITTCLPLSLEEGYLWWEAQKCSLRWVSLTILVTERVGEERLDRRLGSQDTGWAGVSLFTMGVYRGSRTMDLGLSPQSYPILVCGTVLDTVQTPSDAVCPGPRGWMSALSLLYRSGTPGENAQGHRMRKWWSQDSS